MPIFATGKYTIISILSDKKLRHRKAQITHPSHTLVSSRARMPTLGGVAPESCPAPHATMASWGRDARDVFTRTTCLRARTGTWCHIPQQGGREGARLLLVKPCVSCVLSSTPSLAFSSWFSGFLGNISYQELPLILWGL